MAKLAFIQPLVYEYLGVEFLTAYLEQSGHQVEVFIPGRNSTYLKNELTRFNPDLVCFSCTTGLHRWAVNIASEIKGSMPVLTVFGGPHATFFPELIYHPAVDIVCLGEGEQALTELAGRIDKKDDYYDVPNFWIKKPTGEIIKNPVRPLIADLDTLPFPQRQIYYVKYPFINRSQKPFLAGRGCPYRCTFCFNHVWQEMYKNQGSLVRLRSPEQLIAEILQVKNRYGLRTVYLQDDIILLNRTWFFTFLDLYRKTVNLPFICLLRADLVDEKIVKTLKLSNCHRVFFGVETGDETLRTRVLKKSVTDQQIKDTAGWLKKYEIKFRTYNMVGLPDETLTQTWQTVRLNREIQPDYPWCSLFYPYPRTELGEYAQRQHLTDTGYDKFRYSFFYRSVLRNVHNTEINNVQKLFFYLVKVPGLVSLIKPIIKLPFNLVFDLLFLISYVYGYYRSERLTLRDVWITARYNFTRFYFK